MIKSINIVKSDRKNKKWRAIIETKKGETINVDFGDSRYEDFTQHKDEARKERYLMRHQKEDWKNWKKPAFWSRYLLWDLPNMNAALKKIKDKLIK